VSVNQCYTHGLEVVLLFSICLTSVVPCTENDESLWMISPLSPFFMSDTILNRPFFNYYSILNHYGHYLQGRTLEGDLFTIDRPGEDASNDDDLGQPVAVFFLVGLCGGCLFRTPHNMKKVSSNNAKVTKSVRPSVNLMRRCD